jgi:hypothetical protein
MSEQFISPLTPYEPPRIEARTSIEPLVAYGHPLASGNADTGVSAVFRPL